VVRGFRFYEPRTTNYEHALNIDGPTTSCLTRFYSAFTVKFYGQAERAISNGKLNVLLRLHIRPINVVVFHGPS
jgi:hypothetical protein